MCQVLETCACDECTAAHRVVSPGDIVTVDLEMTPENDFIPEPLFDRNGRVTFVVGWGNYLPALHELVLGKAVGAEFHNVSIDAGWGDANPDLVMELPKHKIHRFLGKDNSLPPVGSVLKLQGGLIQLAVLSVNEAQETLLVDANPPLAGASYKCSLKLLQINHLPSKKTTRYQVSTWALGCFWGGELAFMRVPGVVGTRVGYTHGTVTNPTYEAVCTGKTLHREAIMVIYDPDLVSYQQLMDVALARLKATNNPASSDTLFGNFFAEEEEPTSTSQQYHHGFYYHSQHQREMAQQHLLLSNLYDIEQAPAAVFYPAEEYHQQYLLKGGQSARKGAKETIRCYG